MDKTKTEITNDQLVKEILSSNLSEAAKIRLIGSNYKSYCIGDTDNED